MVLVDRPSHNLQLHLLAVQRRQCRRLEVVTNQMSTQLRGEYEVVMSAVSRCTRTAMERIHPLVLVAKFLSSDLPIGRLPDLD